MKKLISKSVDQQLIREILGDNKFLMLNLVLVEKLGLMEAVLMTFILDKLEHTLSWDSNSIDNGIVVFRKEVEGKFKLSDYQQRKIERNLIQSGVLTITAKFDGLNTFNTYKVNLDDLVNLLRPE